MEYRTENVLRLRRTDDRSKHTLINIAKDGRKDLDLKIIGTDRDTLFATAIRETDVKSLQERGFTGDLEEWKAQLSFVLWNRRPEGSLPEFLQQVEAVSAIGGSTLTITLRKRISGIILKLGSIELKETPPSDNFDSFDWVDTAAATSDELRNQLETLQASAESQKDQVAKLTTELDMLVKAKKEHEDELLSKFAALMNAKKLKIRDQQRLLNCAQVDRSRAEQVSSGRTSRTSRTAGPSRGSKRKAVGAEPTFPGHENEDAETVDGSEAADDDGSPRDGETPGPSEDDAETEADDEDEDEASSKKPELAATSQANPQGRSRRAAGTMDVDNIGEAPPHRELPFKPKRTAKPAKEPTPPPMSTANEGDDDDDETDDDEL